MSDLIYVETTIPSFYYETREAAVHQARRQWTREWWGLVRQELLVTSQPVLSELKRAPEPKRSNALALLAPLPILEPTPMVEKLMVEYLKHRLMPRDAAGDARHLAIATVFECATVATWNCQHLANANKRAHIEHVNRLLGFATPALVTPYMLLQVDEST
jgi:hypothetical protein